MQGEKAAFRPCAYAEGALTHHGQTLVPGGDRLYLRLEGGGRCTVEPLDYSIGRSRLPSRCRKSAPKARCGATCAGRGSRSAARGLRLKARSRSYTAWMRGPSRPMRGLASKSGQTTRSWQRSRVSARACRQGSEAACRGKSHHDSGSVSKAEVGLLQGCPLETLTPKWGKQLAGHAGLTDAL